MKKIMIRLFTGSFLAVILMVHVPSNAAFAAELEDAIDEQTVEIVEPEAFQAESFDAEEISEAEDEESAWVEEDAYEEEFTIEETPEYDEDIYAEPEEAEENEIEEIVIEEPQIDVPEEEEAEIENIETEEIETEEGVIEEREIEFPETEDADQENVGTEEAEIEEPQAETSEIGEVEIEKTKTEEAETEEITIEEPQTEVPETVAQEAEPIKTEAQKDDISRTESQQTDLTELEIPVHEYSSQVVGRDINVVRLTEKKTKRIITEYLSNGWRIVTTQYILDGVVVDQTVYNQVDERREIQEENIRETQELEKEIAEAKRIEQEKKQAKKDAETAQAVIEKTIENKMNSLSMDELLEFYEQMARGDSTDFTRQIVREVNAATSDNYKYTEGDAIKLLKSIYKNFISGSLKALPGGAFYGDAVTGLISGTLGLQPQQTDLEKVIENAKEELHTELTNGFKETQRNIDNLGTLKSYGSRLDEFSAYSKLRAEGIQDYKTNADYSDLEKTVRIANLIGASDEWYTGANNGNIMMSLTTAAEVFKGETNTDSRDLFNIIYDINKETSLFAGEAMAKSQEKINKAVQGFVQNCGVVLECLKAHETIANYTDEQIQSLDSQTRAIYDRIHASKNTIAKKIRELSAVFLGDKNAKDEHDRYGILDKAGQYQGKNKTTYIDYGNNGNGVCLKDTLKESRGRDYIKADEYTDSEKINKAVTDNGLKSQDIHKIAAHAASMGMSIKDYLNASGFNTDNMEGFNFLIANYYYHPEDTLLGFKLGPDNEGIMAYSLGETRRPVVQCGLTIIGVCMEYGAKIKEEIYGNMNENVCFMNFEAK